jgi:ABC-type transporter Mla subunit MlaD
MRMKALKLSACIFLVGIAALCARPALAQNQKEYLSNTEAAKVRESMDPSERIRLFVSFASDRLKQLQYELDHPGNTVRRSERLNSLLNAFSGCLDEAIDRMQLSVEKQEDAREGIKALQTQAPQFLAYLTDSAAKSPESKTYKDNLDDAIESAKDAIRSADDAAKENAPPPPVRRPQ